MKILSFRTLNCSPHTNQKIVSVMQPQSNRFYNILFRNFRRKIKCAPKTLRYLRRIIFRLRAPGTQPVRTDSSSSPEHLIEISDLISPVNELTTRARGLWLGFLALLAYLIVSVGSVSNLDLLFDNPIRLPILSVDLPVREFFIFSPMLLVVNQFYFLLILSDLGERVQKVNRNLERHVANDSIKRANILKIDSFFITRMLINRQIQTYVYPKYLLKIMAWVTLLIVPTATLILFQIKFLPYQDELVTWIHRTCFIISITICCYFWPIINHGMWGHRIYSTVIASLLIITLGATFSIGVATFPGERVHRVEKTWLLDCLLSIKHEHGEREREICSGGKYTLRDGLFSGPINLTTGVRASWFSNSLSLPNRQLIDVDQYNKILGRISDSSLMLKPWHATRTKILRERNLRGAVFDRSDLRNFDFEGAKLDGASFRFANLDGINLSEASLQDADFFKTELKGAFLRGADLKSAELNEASLQGANLDDAHLQGAEFNGANIVGATLISANMQGVALKNTNLSGANLEGASLQGASLVLARLQGVSLNHASLQGASLKGADLRGATLHKTDLRAAILNSANFQGSWLKDTYLWKSIGEPSLRRKYEDGGNKDSRGSNMALVSRPNTSAPADLDPKIIVAEALDGVNAERIRQHITKRLAVLTSTSTASAANWNPDWWNNQEGRIEVTKYRRNLIDTILRISCWEVADAHYFVRGIISRLQSNKEFANFLEKGNSNMSEMIIKLQEQKYGACPGIRDIDKYSLGILKKRTAMRNIDVIDAR